MGRRSQPGWAPPPIAATTPTTLFRTGVLLLALAACSDAAGPEAPGRPETARYTVRIVASVGIPIDSAVVRLEGPTPRTFGMLAGEEAVMDGLAPGVYQVAIEGWHEETVAGFTEFEETFEAGDRQERPVTFERVFAPAEFSATLDAGLVELRWDSVPGAVEYQVESRAGAEAAEFEFQGRTEGTSLRIGPFEAGSYTVRVRAVDRFENGGPPAEVALTVERARFPITVEVEEAASLPWPVGSVVSEPEGILCGDGHSRCQADFAEGEQVLLKHVWPGVPQSFDPIGTGFGGWGGDCSGFDSCALTVDGPKEVVATAADELHWFVLWPYISSSTGTVPAYATWTLTFEEAGWPCEQYIEFGGANSPDDCFVWVAPGSHLTISSPVGPVNWYDLCESVDGTTCHVVVPPGGGWFQADWDWSPPQGHSLLEIVRSEVGRVRSDVGGIYGLPPYPLDCGGPELWCSQVYPDGTAVTLTAEPIEGYRFTGWTGGACSGVGPCVIEVEEWTRVEAYFEPISLGTGFALDQYSRIPAGTFQMGDNAGYGRPGETPVHTVDLTRDFYLQRTEVTQAQWQDIMGENPSGFSGCELCPVEQVSWEDIQLFLSRLNARHPDAGFRLPTEAEWEYAARAGTTGDYGGTGALDDMGWHAGNSDAGTGARTHPVALKHANDWGLYDMHGNVREWVQDRYSTTYYSESPTEDPPGPPCRTNAGGTQAQAGGPYRTGWCLNRARVLRGGSWQQGALSARSASRHSSLQDHRTFIDGFRLARSR